MGVSSATVFDGGGEGLIERVLAHFLELAPPFQGERIGGEIELLNLLGDINELFELIDGFDGPADHFEIVLLEKEIGRIGERFATERIVEIRDQMLDRGTGKLLLAEADDLPEVGLIKARESGEADVHAEAVWRRSDEFFDIGIAEIAEPIDELDGLLRRNFFGE